jgi:hypothetical protein
LYTDFGGVTGLYGALTGELLDEAMSRFLEFETTLKWVKDEASIARTGGADRFYEAL